MGGGTFHDEYDNSKARFALFQTGMVVDNNDPEQRGRVKIDIPGFQSITN